MTPKNWLRALLPLNEGITITWFYCLGWRM